MRERGSGPCYTQFLPLVADTGDLPNPTIPTPPSPRLSMSSEWIWFLSEIEPSSWKPLSRQQWGNTSQVECRLWFYFVNMVQGKRVVQSITFIDDISSLLFSHSISCSVSSTWLIIYYSLSCWVWDSIAFQPNGILWHVLTVRLQIREPLELRTVVFAQYGISEAGTLTA